VPPGRDDVERLRAEAADALVAAARSTNAATRIFLLQIANAYDRLAEHAARREAGTWDLPQGVSFGPAALNVVCQAFDEAWALLRPLIGPDPHEIENARLALAKAVLAVADEDSADPAMVRDAALQALALRRV
jgi:hypothetical protein